MLLLPSLLPVLNYEKKTGDGPKPSSQDDPRWTKVNLLMEANLPSLDKLIQWQHSPVLKSPRHTGTHMKRKILGYQHQKYELFADNWLTYIARILMCF